ncbi:hypothetical protein EDL79_04610 [Ehrlichia ruminantium]|uniref:DUF3514 domain-containing protein n=1 Tax=Ehrlichia ruminantium TaxID=779 RepID=A0AAE6Q9P2_EHRRU|nr:hypothetical protein [Ehrlichia ruminantium]QGR03811.1 hypothetical protein EDL80_04600 [Ehrlichia ruminantium]QGR04738.1 hypothetical protein EDL79_04610 [Ehrlichia ruminantium]
MLFSEDKEKDKKNNNDQENGDLQGDKKQGACNTDDESDSKNQTVGTGVGEEEEGVPASSVTGAEGGAEEGTEISGVAVPVSQPSGVVENVYVMQGARPKTKVKTRGTKPVTVTQPSSAVEDVYITQGAKPKAKIKAKGAKSGKKGVDRYVSKGEERLSIESSVVQDQAVSVDHVTSEIEKLDITDPVSSRRGPSIVVEDAFIPEDIDIIDASLLDPINRDISGYFSRRKSNSAELRYLQCNFVCNMLLSLYHISTAGHLALRSKVISVLGSYTSCPGIIEPLMNMIIMSMFFNAFGYGNPGQYIVYYRMNSLDFKAVQDMLRCIFNMLCKRTHTTHRVIDSLLCNYPDSIQGTCFPYSANYYKAILQLFRNLVRELRKCREFKYSEKQMVNLLLVYICIQFYGLSQYVKPIVNPGGCVFMQMLSHINYVMMRMYYKRLHDPVVIGHLTLTESILAFCSPRTIQMLPKLVESRQFTFDTIVHEIVQVIMMYATDEAIGILEDLVERYGIFEACDFSILTEGGYQATIPEEDDDDYEEHGHHHDGGYSR